MWMSRDLNICIHRITSLIDVMLFSLFVNRDVSISAKLSSPVQDPLALEKTPPALRPGSVRAFLEAPHSSGSPATGCPHRGVLALADKGRASRELVRLPCGKGAAAHTPMGGG